MPPRKPALVFILITMALDVLGFGLIIPVSPRLVMALMNGGHGGTEGEAAPYVSALGATFFAMMFLFSPIMGALSDKVGRRPVLLVNLFGSGIDYLAMAFAPSLGILFLTRIINGISGSSSTVVNAYIADVTPREKRAAAFGMLGAAFGIGFIFGPVIGGLLSDEHLSEHLYLPFTLHGNIRYPFYAAAILTMINWLYGMFVLPESLPPERRNTFSWKRANPFSSLRGLGRYPFVAALAAAMFLLNMAQFGLHTTWVLYTDYRYQWSPSMVGFSLFVVGICGALVQGGLARKLIPKLGEGRSLLIAIAVGAAAFLGYGLAPHGWMIFVIIAIASLGSIGQPAGQALITHTVRPEEQGAIQGTISSIVSIAGIIGPLIGGWVFKIAISDDPPFHLPGDKMNAGAPFFTSAALSVVAFFIAIWALKAHGHEAHAPQDGKCLKCGYDLKGLAPPTCPECGTPVPPKAPAGTPAV